MCPNRIGGLIAVPESDNAERAAQSLRDAGELIPQTTDLRIDVIHNWVRAGVHALLDLADALREGRTH